MKLISQFLLTGLMVSGSLFAAAIDERNNVPAQLDREDKLIYTVRLRMPYGKSTWTDSFPAAGASPLHIMYEKDSGCPRSAYLTVFVRVAKTKQWEQTEFKGSYDYFSGGAIDGIRFDINQPFYNSMTCTWKIYSEEGLQNPPPQEGEKLIGAITYKGGFAQDVPITVSPKRAITHFRIDVPKFCQDIEILEASTVSEGMKDKATLIDEKRHLYSVNEGAGARITQILMTANAPIGSSCQLPVYVTEK